MDRSRWDGVGVSSGPQPATDVRTARTVERLLDAAERLVAVHGNAGVSDRAIIEAAGQRNKSAIAYHFTDRQGLLDAIWDRGTVPVNTARSARLDELIAAGLDGDLRSLVRAYVEPQVAQLAESNPSYWARFTERVLAERPLVFMSWVRVDLERFDETVPLEVLLDLLARMQELTKLAGGVAELRVAMAARTCVTLLAAWERDVEAGLRSPRTATAYASQVVEVVLAVLTAPAPAAAPITRGFRRRRQTGSPGSKPARPARS